MPPLDDTPAPAFDPGKPFAVAPPASAPPPFDPSKPFAEAPKWTKVSPFTPKTQAEVDEFRASAAPGSVIKHPKTGELFTQPAAPKLTPEEESIDLAGAGFTPAPKPPSAVGAAARGAVRGIVPAAGGIVGMGAGAAAGAAAGALGGPLAPVTVPGGAIIGGLIGGFGGSYGAGKAQEEVLKHLPESAKEKIGQSEEQRRGDVETHPYAAMAGELAPNLAAFVPGAARAGATIGERVLSRGLPAGLMGGQEAATELVQGEPVDPAKVAIAAGSGALMNRPTGIGHALTEIGAVPVRAITGQRAPATPTASSATPAAAAAPQPPTGVPEVGEQIAMPIGGDLVPMTVAHHTPEGDVILADENGTQYRMPGEQVAQKRQPLPEAPPPAAEPAAPPEGARLSMDLPEQPSEPAPLEPAEPIEKPGQHTTVSVNGEPVADTSQIAAAPAPPEPPPAPVRPAMVPSPPPSPTPETSALTNLRRTAEAAATGEPISTEQVLATAQADLARQATLRPGSFRTAKGSAYEVHEDGTTTRNKSYHPEHGETDQGPQPRSEQTFYVTTEDAQKLGEIQSQGGGRRIIDALPGAPNMRGIRYIEGPDTGKFERRTVVNAQSEPAPGLTPVELWNGGSRIHFGNPITEVAPRPAGGGVPAMPVAVPSAAPLPEAPAARPAALPESAEQKLARLAALEAENQMPEGGGTFFQRKAEEEMAASPLPPLQPGMLRLYRGEGAEQEKGGGWFTTDPVKASLYGRVSYVDVSREDLLAFAQGHGGEDEWLTDSPAIRARAQPISDAAQQAVEQWRDQVRAGVPESVPTGPAVDAEALFDEAQAIMRRLPNDIGKAQREGKLSAPQQAALARLHEIEAALPNTSPEWQRIYAERRATTDAERARLHQEFGDQQRQRLTERGFAVGDKVAFTAPSMLPGAGGMRHEGVIRQSSNGSVYVLSRGERLDPFSNPWSKVEGEPTVVHESPETTVTHEVLAPTAASPDIPHLRGNEPAPRWLLENTPEGRRQLAVAAGFPPAEALRLSKMNWSALEREPAIVARLDEQWRRGQVVPPAEPAPQQAAAPEVRNAPIVTDEQHTKTKRPIFAVRFPEKPAIEGLGPQARKMGGQWSSYRGDGMRPGWMFKTREAADRFAEWARGYLGMPQRLADAEASGRATGAAGKTRAIPNDPIGQSLMQGAPDVSQADRVLKAWINGWHQGERERGTPGAETPLPAEMDQIEQEAAELAGSPHPAEPIAPRGVEDGYVPAGMDPDLYRMRQEVARAREETEADPSEEQKTAGNYAKGKIDFHGLPFVMENPAGSYREGVDGNGAVWSVKMPVDYGYLSRTNGADGEYVDAYLGHDLLSQTAYVIDQAHAETGAFDEHKIMLGFSSWADARNAFLDAFSDERGQDRIGSVTPMSLDQLKAWLKEGDTRSPVGQTAMGFDVEPHPGLVIKSLETGETTHVPVRGQVRAAEPAPQAMPNSDHPQVQIADQVAGRLIRKEPIDARYLQSVAEEVYGSKLSEGKFTRAEIYDALELGVNRYIAAHPVEFDPRADLRFARQIVRELGDLKKDLPTQTVRAGEKDLMQQFSTPPDYAFTAAWAAKIGAHDSVLEPSAGTGSLVAPALNAKPREVVVNELSKNRAPLVESLGPDRSFRENAEQLHNVLPEDVRPSVVLMNPPFSSAGERMAGRRQLGVGAQHIEAALERLEPGGRLVAIVGRGMRAYTGQAPSGVRFGEGTGAAFREWWDRIGKEYDVRANVGVPGEVYQKYGTTFGTQLVVIDKNPPSGRAPILADATDIPDLMEKIAGVRDDRLERPADVAGEPAGQPVAAQPGRQEAPPGSADERVPGPANPLPRPVAEPGVRTGTAGAGAGPDLPGGTGARGAPVVRPEPQTGGRDALVPQQSERPGSGGADQHPAVAAGEGVQLAGSRTGPDGVVLRPEGSAGSVLSSGGEPPGVTPESVRVDEIAAAPRGGDITDSVYEPYRPQRIKIAGAQPHPGALVQSTAMASVLPPPVDYAPRLPKQLITAGALSDAQLEAITYAGQAHSQMLPVAEGETPYRRGYFIGDGTGPQPLTAKIMTPTGWRHMGDIAIGDEVIAVDGSASKVTGVFPKGEKEVYRVLFTDGAETEACSEHLWSTTDKHQRFFRKLSIGTEAYWNSKILSTEQINKRLHRAHDVPVPDPVQFAEQPLPVDPYLVGALLGDGCLRPTGSTQIVATPEMMALIVVRLPAGILARKVATRDYHYNLIKEGGRAAPRRSSPLAHGLRELGVMGLRAWEKHVPEQILLNSPRVRLACLRGLMDTDGYVDKRGINTFTSVSERLARDVMFLVRSLGGIARLSTKITPKRLAYNVTVKVPVCPFILPAKAGRWRPHHKYVPRRYFKSIESVGLKTVQCISIAHPSHLYVTDDFVVTHNTGKGREVAGIIMDNLAQGRRKALWVSEKQPLINDAKRDWKGIGGDPQKIFSLSKTKAGADLAASDGIAFATYDTLRSSERLGKDEAGKAISGKSRIDQIVDWLGKDFDGVIAFDESHALANSIAVKGTRGVKDAAQKALAGVDLQDRLPNARVIYVSATGATEVSNLAYADRLGLWGRGTAFANKADFISQIHNGGIAAMELVARDMKAMGSYIARSLSYDDVRYDRVEHKLSPEQRQTYDALAEAWQVTLNNIEQALVTTAPKDSMGNPKVGGGARAAALSAYWGGHQRFFNQIITAMQMPSVIRSVERDLAEKRQAVLQLVNTNEASQKRGLAKIDNEADLEDLDMTPRDQLMQLVEHSFPVAQHEMYLDDNGNERSRPVRDSKGNIVENKQAVAMREALLDQLGSIRVPDGPLEMLINHFGPDQVAEVTGRKQRVVKKPDEKGNLRTQIENRSGAANVTEADAFQNGKKPILVFSQAGGTGRSYHADNTSPSKDAQRSHYLVQAGWRADTAIQGFGRTHRTNQASAPIYHLVTTDLEGQRRFISSIARRLAQLGALTKGERRAGEQGMFSARDNLESTEAGEALYSFFRDLHTGKVPEITEAEFARQTGLRLTDENGNLRKELPPIPQFLNRLLSMKVDQQNAVFGAFERRLNDAVDRAAAAGTLDVGTETLKGDRITKDEERTVHTDPGSGAETKYVRLKVEDKNNPASFDDISTGRSWLTGGRKPVSYIQNQQTGRVYAVTAAHTATNTKTGAVTEQYRIAHPMSYHFIDRANVVASRWRKIDDPMEARALWDKQVAETPEYSARDVHLITGAVLPIWDRLAGTPKVYRTQTETGEGLLGRVVDEKNIAQTLKALGAEGAMRQHTPQEIADRVLDGDRATLANGWALKRSQVAGESRIELTGPGWHDRTELAQDGIFSERIGYDTRYFVPTGEDAGKVIERVTARRPVTEFSGDEGGGSVLGRLMRSEEGGAPLPQALQRLAERIMGRSEGGGGEPPPPDGGTGGAGSGGERPRSQLDTDLDRVMHTSEKGWFDNLTEKARNFWQDRPATRFERYWFDEAAEIRRAERQVYGGGLAPGRLSPYIATKFARNWKGALNMALDHAQIEFGPDGEIRPIDGSKPLRGIWKQLSDDQRESGRQTVKAFAAWSIARRAERLLAEGREKLVSPEFIERWKGADAEYKRPDGSNLFEDVHAELQQWHDRLLDLGEQAGIINKESRALWQHDDYVPFYRAFEEERVSSPGADGKGTVNIRSPIQRLEGGESKINNIYENTVLNAEAMIRRSMANIAGQKLRDMLVFNTDTLTPLSKEARLPYGDPAIQEGLRAAGLDPTTLTAAAKEGARDLFSALKRKDPDVISVMDNGKANYYRVNDPLMLEAALAAGPRTMTGVASLLAAPARLLRAAVVFDPAFALAHNLRMAEHAYILTGANPIASFAHSLRQVGGPSPDALKLMAAGVMLGKYDIDLPGHIRKEVMSPEYQASLIDTPLKAARFVREFGEKVMHASDIGPRIAVYQRALKQGASEAEALNAARDLLDFSTHGNGAAAMFLAQTIPFLNARWQGMARTYRGFTGSDRSAILTRGALVTAATLALWYENKDDPEYQRKEDWDRQYAWQIKVAPGTWVRLPKPFELGALFGSLPEILADYWDNGSGRQLQNATGSLFANVFKFNPVPVAIRPGAEVMTNYDMFTGQPIINEREQALEPDLRYGPSDSRSVVAATQAFNSVSPYQVAPANVQHMIQGYLAGWGTYITAAADYIGEQTGALPSHASPVQTPVVGRFLHETPEAGNRLMRDYYDLRRGIDAVGNSIKDAEKNQDKAMVDRLMAGHPEYNPAIEKRMNAVGLQLSKMRGQYQHTEMNPGLSKEAKTAARTTYFNQRDAMLDQIRPLLRQDEGLPARP